MGGAERLGSLESVLGLHLRSLGPGRFPVQRPLTGGRNVHKSSFTDVVGNVPCLQAFPALSILDLQSTLCSSYLLNSNIHWFCKKVSLGQ